MLSAPIKLPLAHIAFSVHPPRDHHHRHWTYHTTQTHWAATCLRTHDDQHVPSQMNISAAKCKTSPLQDVVRPLETAGLLVTISSGPCR